MRPPTRCDSMHGGNPHHRCVLESGHEMPHRSKISGFWGVEPRAIDPAEFERALREYRAAVSNAVLGEKLYGHTLAQRARNRSDEEQAEQRLRALVLGAEGRS